MIKKKDWENLKKELEDRNINLLLAVEQDKALLELCKKKIAEFSEEKEEMPEEVKEVIKEVTK